MVGINFHRGKARGAVAAQIVRAHLVDIQRNQVHFRMMMRAVPAVSFQKAVDDMLRVRILPVDGGDRGKLRTVTSHTVQPL